MKYLLDTNIVSQYTKLPPDPRVDAWMQRTDDRDMYLCDIVFAELWFGVQLLPAGKKKTALGRWLEHDLSMQFFDRVVFMGLETARHYGTLVARAKKKGFNLNAMDALIAATAAANGMAVATLKRKDFEPFGVELVEF